jgi:Glycosyl transferases group 1
VSLREAIPKPIRHAGNMTLWHGRLALMRVGRGVRWVGTIGLLLAVAFGERARVMWRRLFRKRPRLVWGPSALINNKYWSEALRERGWESHTVIDLQTRIASRSDFNVYQDDLVAQSRLPPSLRQYAMFIWALRHGDVLVRNFDLGFLRSTPLAMREFLFTRIAGKRVIAMPYGGDIAVVGHLGEWHDAWLEDYPQLDELAGMLKERVDHTAENADVSILTKQVGYAPRHDVLWISPLGIDPEVWRSNGLPSQNDGRNGPVRIFHSPNHAALKGTPLLEEAVETLRAEGLKVELDLITGLTNEELRRHLLDTDIAGDQFTRGGYALFALEGMAAEKPVLSGLAGDPGHREILRERGCPVVETSPEGLLEDLRRLVTDPDLRRDLGKRGREFVLRYHSYEAVATEWEAVIEFAWRGKPLPEHLRPA